MSSKQDKKLRKIAKQITQQAVVDLVGNTYDVITEMKENWSFEERAEFCEWFLHGTEPTWVGLAEPDDRQLEFDFMKEAENDTRGQG